MNNAMEDMIGAWVHELDIRANIVELQIVFVIADLSWG